MKLVVRSQSLYTAPEGKKPPPSADPRACWC